jgi:hypothetical protein
MMNQDAHGGGYAFLAQSTFYKISILWHNLSNAVAMLLASALTRAIHAP